MTNEESLLEPRTGSRNSSLERSAKGKREEKRVKRKEEEKESRE